MNAEFRAQVEALRPSICCLAFVRVALCTVIPRELSGSGNEEAGQNPTELRLVKVWPARKAGSGLRPPSLPYILNFVSEVIHLTTFYGNEQMRNTPQKSLSRLRSL